MGQRPKPPKESRAEVTTRLKAALERKFMTVSGDMDWSAVPALIANYTTIDLVAIADEMEGK